VTFTEGRDTFKALRALNELASTIDECTSSGMFKTRHRRLPSRCGDGLTAEGAGVGKDSGEGFQVARFFVGDVCEHVDYGAVVVIGWDPGMLPDGSSVDDRCYPRYRLVCLENNGSILQEVRAQ
jgi:hypothetical protein